MTILGITCIPWSAIEAIGIVVAALVAAATLLFGYREYRNANRQKRAEMHERLRIRFKTDPTLKDIMVRLEDNQGFSETPVFDRFLFLGFFEDVALLVNSGLMKPEIAHYMFAYYAVKCWKDEDFWKPINRDSHYWRVFREFVRQMQELEQNKSTIPANKRLKFRL